MTTLITCLTTTILPALALYLRISLACLPIVAWMIWRAPREDGWHGGGN